MCVVAIVITTFLDSVQLVNSDQVVTYISGAPEAILHCSGGKVVRR